MWTEAWSSQTSAVTGRVPTQKPPWSKVLAEEDGATTHRDLRGGRNIAQRCAADVVVMYAMLARLPSWHEHHVPAADELLRDSPELLRHYEELVAALGV